MVRLRVSIQKSKGATQCVKVPPKTKRNPIHATVGGTEVVRDVVSASISLNDGQPSLLKKARSDTSLKKALSEENSVLNTSGSRSSLNSFIRTTDNSPSYSDVKRFGSDSSLRKAAENPILETAGETPRESPILTRAESVTSLPDGKLVIRRNDSNSSLRRAGENPLLESDTGDTGEQGSSILPTYHFTDDDFVKAIAEEVLTAVKATEDTTKGDDDQLLMKTDDKDTQVDAEADDLELPLALHDVVVDPASYLPKPDDEFHIDGCCKVLKLKLHNDIQDKQGVREGTYHLKGLSNGRKYWVKDDEQQGIWYVPEYRDWAIGSMDNFESKRCAITTTGGLGTTTPNDARNPWEFSDGTGNWICPGPNDMSLICQDCCRTIEVKLDHDVKKKQSCREGLYYPKRIFNQRNYWVTEDQTQGIWYVPEYKDWAIGSMNNFKSKRCAITTTGGLGTEHPYSSTNTHVWEYANGNGAWEKAPLDDVKIVNLDRSSMGWFSKWIRKKVKRRKR